MKILEILEPTITKSDFHGSLRKEKNSGVVMNTFRKRLGFGYYSSAKNHPTDPHLVKKWTHNVREVSYKDPYNTFMEYLIDKKLIGSNIHFPRLYNIRQIKDSKGYAIWTYSIEKLIDKSQLTMPEFDFLVRKMFDEKSSVIEKYEDDLKRLASGHIIENDLIYDVTSRMGRKFKEAVREGTYDEFSDQETIDALRIMHEFHEGSGLTCDLHANNFMYRRTPYGIQLVFTDPFSDI